MDLKLPEGLHIVSPSDQRASLDLIAKAPMNVAGTELYYDRRPDYHALINARGPVGVALRATRGGDGRNPLAICSITSGPKWIRGKLEPCAYIGDFRTNGSPEAAAVWRRSYAPLLRAVRDSEAFGRPRYVVTAILKQNVAALVNLAQNKKSLGFRYDLLTEMNMVNVCARLPWCRRSRIKTVRAGASDEGELKAFLNHEQRRMNFGDPFSFDTSDDQQEGEWQRRERQWRGFRVDRFLIQRDEFGRITACTLPWDPSYAKRMTVRRTTRRIELALKISHLLGLDLPRVGESLRTLYLTHLNFSREQDERESLRSFLEFLFRERRGPKPFHMISFAEPVGRARSYSGYLFQKTAVSLFNVALPEDAAFEAGDGPFHFEMGLV